MKTILFALVLMLSQSAFARQYFQCSLPDVDSTDVMVVNLQTEQGGTLFLSSGMQNPEDERILVKIAFDKVEGGKHFFNVVDENGAGHIEIPSSVIGKNTNSVNVDILFSGYSFTFSCFARIYND